MAGEEFDGQITETTARIERVQVDMETVAGEFHPAVVEWIQQYYRTTIEEAVVEHAEHTRSLGDRLTQLKADLAQLLDEAPALVAKHLNNESIWAHRSKSEWPVDAYKLSSGGTENIDRGARRLTGYVGSLLKKYGYFEKMGGHTMMWETAPPHAYRFGLSLSKKVHEILGRYNSLNNELANGKKLIRDLEKKKAAAQAKDLWNKA